MTDWLKHITFNNQGLIPAIAQDHETGDVLMVAWMNADSLKLTVEKNQAVYWSRSRKQLWHKGETSGHFQDIHDILLDCDADVICLKVTQHGGIACHTGRRSCFFKKLVNGQWVDISDPLKDPNDIYGQKNQTNTPALTDSADTLSALAAILEKRKTADADSSYVASLYHKGLNKILEKVGEESVEVLLAAKDHATKQTEETEKDVIYEVADLWFHNLVMLSWFNIAPTAILDELARRFGVSGHAEKAARKSKK